jgi:Dockerin type I domain
MPSANLTDRSTAHLLGFLLGVLLSASLLLCVRPIVAATDVAIPPNASGIRANFNVAVLSAPDLGVGYERVYFAIDGDPDWVGHIYYNVRHCPSYPCDQATWSYTPYSPVVVTLPDSAVELGDVLHDSQAPFYSTADHHSYSWVMYFVGQTQACLQSLAGLAYVSFSDDGISWTPPTLLQHPGGPTQACVVGAQNTNTVPVEALAATYDQPNHTIYLIGLEGGITQLFDRTKFAETQTYVATASTSDPTTISVLGQVSSAGTLMPNIDNCPTWSYFANLGAVYDPIGGNLYLTRGYAYPFDFTLVPADAWAPCNQDCPLFSPNRVQIYKMRIGALSNIGMALTGTWSLVGDYGASVGYKNSNNGSCTPGNSCDYTALVPPQGDDGHDFNTLSMRRNSFGQLDAIVLDGIPTLDLFGGTGSSTISDAGCVRTGSETEYEGFTPAYSQGDAQPDGVVDLGDVFLLINYLYAGGVAPNYPLLADATGDSVVSIADVFYLINYLFAGGPAPGARPLRRPTGTGGVAQSGASANNRFANGLAPVLHNHESPRPAVGKALVAGPKDELKIGSVTAPANGATLQVPVLVKDTSGTTIGIDQPLGHRISQLVFQTVYGPNSCLTIDELTTAGGVLAGRTANFSTNVVDMHNLYAYVFSSTESSGTNTIPFAQDAWSTIGQLTVETAGCSPGVYQLPVTTQGTAVAGFGCDQCTESMLEETDTGTLLTTNGSITLTPVITERLANGGFESITTSTNTAPDGSWTRSAYTGMSYSTLVANGFYHHSGTDYAWLGHYTSSSQTLDSAPVNLPAAATSITLSTWVRVSTSENAQSALDTLKIQLIDAQSGALVVQLLTLSNLSSAAYTQYSFDVTAYKGRAVKVRFVAANNSTNYTDFFIDDVSLRSDG